MYTAQRYVQKDKNVLSPNSSHFEVPSRVERFETNRVDFYSVHCLEISTKRERQTERNSFQREKNKKRKRLKFCKENQLKSM